MDSKTYPCVVGRRIVELTTEQIKQRQWASTTPDRKIDILLRYIRRLEKRISDLETKPTRY